MDRNEGFQKPQILLLNISDFSRRVLEINCHAVLGKDWIIGLFKLEFRISIGFSGSGNFVRPVFL